MARIYSLAVTLVPDGKGGLQPVTFVYRGGRFVIKEVLDCWVMRGRDWWTDPNVVGKAPHEVTIWRVRTSDGGMFELCQDDKNWTMFRVWD